MNLWNRSLDEESETVIAGAFGDYAVSHFDIDGVACGNQPYDRHLSKTDTLDPNGSVLHRDELTACRQIEAVNGLRSYLLTLCIQSRSSFVKK